MSSVSAPFYNVATKDPVLAQQQFMLHSELADLILRWQKYLTDAGVNVDVLKKMKGGTTVVTQPGNGVVVLTMTPNPVTANPNPSAA